MTLRTVATVVISLLVGLANAHRARACQCVEVSPEAASSRAAAVFEGQVISIGEANEGPSRITFNVVRTWKGADAERVVVAAHPMQSLCGVDFEVGRSYLVYAVEQEGALTTGLCERTRRIEDAEEDLLFLGAGVTPVDVTRPLDPPPPPVIREPPADRAGCAGCAISAGITSESAWIVVVALGLTWIVRKTWEHHPR